MKLVPTIDAEVEAALQRAGFSGNGTTLVVGVSGGPDSTALLHSLHRLSPTHGLNLHVAHLNHNFREEAAADARFAASLAAELGLPATVEKRDPLAYQRDHRVSSFEQAARELRYKFLAEVADHSGAAAVVVGHTSDDLAETVLAHILRGSGLHGLRGMSEVSGWPWPREAPNLLLFRPLLAIRKADTMGYCQELGKEFRIDPGNALPRFTRNRIRNSLLPHLAAEYNPKIADALVRLARTASLELDFLELQTDLAWDETVERLDPPSSKVVTFDRAALAETHPALRRLLLRRGYAELSGDTRRLQEGHLASMCVLASQKTSGGLLNLPGGLLISTTARHLIMASSAEALPCPFPQIEGVFNIALPTAPGEVTRTHGPGWQVVARITNDPSLDALPNSGALTAILDLHAIGDGVVLRSRQTGDRFQPLGMGGSKKLQDFFTDAQVPRAWRDRVPLLVAGNGIAWIVGHRIAEWAKVQVSVSNGQPKPALMLEYELE